MPKGIEGEKMDTNGTQPLTGQIVTNGYHPPQAPQPSRKGIYLLLASFLCLALAGGLYGVIMAAVVDLVILAAIHVFRQGPRIR